MKYEALKLQVAEDLTAAIQRSADGGIVAGPLSRGPIARSGSPIPTGEMIAAILLDALAEKRPPRASGDALAAECSRIVMAWDVRCVGKLRELFPASFPASLRTGPLTADYDEHGDWCVFRSPGA